MYFLLIKIIEIKIIEDKLRNIRMMLLIFNTSFLKIHFIFKYLINMWYLYLLCGTMGMWCFNIYILCKLIKSGNQHFCSSLEPTNSTLISADRHVAHCWTAVAPLCSRTLELATSVFCHLKPKLPLIHSRLTLVPTSNHCSVLRMIVRFLASTNENMQYLSFVSGLHL